MIRFTPQPLFVLAAFALLVSPALAAEPSVGDTAPEIGTPSWVLNRPDYDRLADYAGDVVVVFAWGIGSWESEGVMPHMRKLYERHAAKGLQLFAVQRYRATDSLATLYSYMYEAGYPVANLGFYSYNSGDTIPYAWVIDVGGTVVWADAVAGNRRILDEVVKREVAKVTYPGLGSAEFDDGARKAARAFVKRKYSKARREAQKVLDDEDSTDEAKADVRRITARIAHIATFRLGVARQAERMQQYLQAFQAYEDLAKRFKGEPEGDAADERLDKIKDNDQLKREIVADEAYLVAIKYLLDAGSTQKMVKILREFAAKYPGTRAARDATDIAQQLEDD